MTRCSSTLLAIAALFSLREAALAFGRPQPAGSPIANSAQHAFDPLVGRWKAHHRKLKDRLTGSSEWSEFDGTFELRLLADGQANVDDSLFALPSGPVRGVGFSAYNPKTGQWAIWGWDSRIPHAALDPPIKGKFENGKGTFYTDDLFKGKPIRVRVIWSIFSPTRAHWEQAYSADGGKTWETNWVTNFTRVET